MSDDVLHWPATRFCPFGDSAPYLSKCWERSAERLARLRDELREEGIDRVVRTAYVSGSLGRMEAVASSDCDIVVVMSRDAWAISRSVMDDVFDCIERVGFQRPKPGGIFGSPTMFEELLDDKTAGKVDEDLAVFGKRIQALLDSQPVLHPSEFESLQRAILQRYASAPVADASAFRLGWLVDDLVRYWRSLCSRTRWLSHDDVVQWRCLNVKLRHSRMLLCAGLMRLLLEVRASDDPVEALLERLKLVPLERAALAKPVLASTTESCGDYRRFQAQLKPLLESRTPQEPIRFNEDLLFLYEAFIESMAHGLDNAVRDEFGFDNLISNGVVFADVLSRVCSEPHGAAMRGGWFGEFR